MKINTRQSSGSNLRALGEYLPMMKTTMTKLNKVPSRGLIYIIDDDPSFSFSLSHVFEIEGYEVIAFSGADAFLEADITDSAIIICDMRMPNLSGLDLQAALNQRSVDLPIIFVSGESTVGQAVSAMKNGAIDFLTKPFEPAELLRKVSETFAEFEQRRIGTDAVRLLSPREFIAFQYFIQGFSNMYVAEKMDIKVSTVKEYKTNILKKLNVTNISDMIETYKI